MTTTEGHERLERARDRFVQAAKEPGLEEPQRKRHRLGGEVCQPQAPPASVTTWKEVAAAAFRRCRHPPAPLPLKPPPLEKRGLDLETAITDATVEIQG